jgi:transposase-like protein
MMGREGMSKKMSMSQMAREHGLKESTLWDRIRYRGWTLEKALNTPVRKVKTYTLNGMSENMNLSQIARDRGISVHTLWDRIHSQGWDLEKALNTPVKKGTNYTLNGKDVVLAEVARQNGIVPETLADRVKTGLTLEEAVAVLANKRRPSNKDIGLIPGQIYDIKDHEYRYEGQSGKFFMFQLVASNARETFTMAQLRDAGFRL